LPAIAGSRSGAGSDHSLDRPVIPDARRAIRNPERKLLKQPCVYILASKRNGTLYTGVTSDLVKRVWEHKNDLAEGFTKRYSVHTLVWFEVRAEMLEAIAREKAIKSWRRQWKVKLIESVNPEWRDLYPDLL